MPFLRIIDGRTRQGKMTEGFNESSCFPIDIRGVPTTWYYRSGQSRFPLAAPQTASNIGFSHSPLDQLRDDDSIAISLKE